eukprot:TRINITY_DN617_c0_g3_i1.p1 TRINITY_DN617_c0_g3~~TRINITY_DN617_c0_g3_i1.p1  ORF type:complete len:517 (+),score=137.27 TRINITY_DN617_c0_g3_i1:25-1551(+)
MVRKNPQQDALESPQAIELERAESILRNLKHQNVLKQQKEELSQKLQQNTTKKEELDAKRKELEEQIQKLERESTIQKLDLNLLKENLKSQQQRAAELKKQQLELQNEFNAVSKQMMLLSEQKKQLMNQLVVMRDNLGKSEEKIESIKEKLSENDRDIYEVEHQKEAVKEQLVKCQNHYRGVEAEIVAKDEALRDYEEKFNGCNNKIQQISDAIASLEAEISSQQDRQKQIESEIESIQNIIKGLELTIKALIAASSALDLLGLGEVARIVVKALQMVKAALENKLKHLTSKVGEISTTVQSYNKELEQKRTDKQTQMVEKDQVTSALNTLRDARQQFENDKFTTEQELASWTSEDYRLDVTTKNLHRIKMRLSKEEEAQIKESDLLNLKLEQIQHSIDESQNRLGYLETSKAQVEKTLQHTSKECSETVASIKKMTVQHDDLVRHLEQHRLELSFVNKQHEGLEKEKQEILSENRTLNEKIKEVDTLFETAQHLINEKENEVTVLRQ